MTSLVRVLVLTVIVALWSMPVGALGRTSGMSGDIETMQVCNTPVQGSASCKVLPLWQANPQENTIWLSTPVLLESHAGKPMGVFIRAFAASAVFWDGRLIGRNGKPAEAGSPEMPGLRDAVIPIPSELSRPGAHRLQIQMSATRAPFRLASPVLAIKVAPFEGDLQPALRNYLPALLTAGGLLALILILATLGWSRGRIAEMDGAIGAALFVGAQLTAEASRAFVPLVYPEQILRLEAVFVCACGFGLLLAGHLIRRFDVGRRKWIWPAQAALMLWGAWALRGLDEKIGWAILSSVALCMGISAIAIRHKSPGAVSLLLVLGTCLLLGMGMRQTFLDRDFYVWAVGLLAVLVVHEVRGTVPAPQMGAAGFAQPSSLCLGSGRTRHLVPPAQIVRLAAADDYTEVFLADATTLLHPEPLHKLLARLPADFLRVHRSHAVNLAHLQRLSKGPRSSVTLSDQSVAPVSRRCLPKLIEAISA